MVLIFPSIFLYASICDDDYYMQSLGAKQVLKRPHFLPLERMASSNKQKNRSLCLINTSDSLFIVSY